MSDVSSERVGFAHVDAGSVVANHDGAENHGRHVFTQDMAVFFISIGEHVQRDRGLFGGEGEGYPGPVVPFGQFLLDTAHDATKAEGGAVFLFEQFVDVERVDGVGQTDVGVHRVPGHIESEQFLLKRQFFGRRKVGRILRLDT